MFRIMGAVADLLDFLSAGIARTSPHQHSDNSPR